ncbi:CDC73 Cell division control protein 73 [Candida maltosa Xu316]|uniref:RNA polymerase II elongation accessory factor, CDC73 family, putative n=1 Tax=Candida maltosa (strain Xu316) TaxID=1245528 RepID=M3JWB6_CANMX|nr:RNA polymerase II elongation accessory factor, CDC73 family, putative [Candida maltosa Xu316]
MATQSPLKALRDATKSGKSVTLFNNGTETDSIADANQVQFGDQKHQFELDMATNFYNDDGFTNPENLKAVVFCWLTSKDSIVEYREKCQSLNIQDFKFLVRTDLITWLNGQSSTCKFVKEEDQPDESSATASGISEEKAAGEKRKLEDPQLERISQFERESIDHNAALRGSKNIDFGYLVADAKKFSHELKRSKVVSNTSSRGTNGRDGPKKQPIILVSPATSALLSLSNIKEFLEEGRFTEPVPGNRPNSGLVMVNHPSDRLISSGQKIMIVDNIENFNKVEYWDRVIAVFTTGQAWQFSRYITPEPKSLFQKYRGFYFGYQGEIAPPQIKEWNVSEIRVDRDKRFKDKVIVRDFWAEIEKILINKGYGKSY